MSAGGGRTWHAASVMSDFAERTRLGPACVKSAQGTKKCPAEAGQFGGEGSFADPYFNGMS